MHTFFLSFFLFLWLAGWFFVLLCLFGVLLLLGGVCVFFGGEVGGWGECVQYMYNLNLPVIHVIKLVM